MVSWGDFSDNSLGTLGAGEKIVIKRTMIHGLPIDSAVYVDEAGGKAGVVSWEVSF